MDLMPSSEQNLITSMEKLFKILTIGPYNRIS